MSIILALYCSTPSVTQLILDFSLSFRLNLSCFDFPNLSTRCKVVSGSSLDTLTFVVLVVLSFSPVWQPNLLPLLFHSLELSSISTFSSSLSIRFLSCCFLYFCYCFPWCYQYPTIARRRKKRLRTVHTYIYINSMRNWILLHFSR